MKIVMNLCASTLQDTKANETDMYTVKAISVACTLSFTHITKHVE